MTVINVQCANYVTKTSQSVTTVESRYLQSSRLITSVNLRHMQLSIMLLPNFTRSFQCSKHNHEHDLYIPDVAKKVQPSWLLIILQVSCWLLNETLHAHLEIVHTRHVPCFVWLTLTFDKIMQFQIQKPDNFNIFKDVYAAKQQNSISDVQSVIRNGKN